MSAQSMEMMMETAAGITNFISVQKEKDALIKVRSFTKAFKNELTKLLKNQLSIAGPDMFIDVGASELTTVLQSKKVDGIELCLRNIFLECTNKLNKKSNISSIIACIEALNIIDSELQQRYVGYVNKNNNLNETLSMLSNASRHVHMDNISETLGVYLNDNKMSSMVMQAYNMAGHGGQIFVDKEYAPTTSVELTNGYTFQFGLNQEFAVATKTKLWKESNVKCIVIDGIIERVSEIHHLLQYFFEEKWAGIIVCRGMKEEVLGTLIANYNRNTLNVLPVIVPYDLEGMNALVDIAKVCGTDVVSSLKGELISTIDISEIVTVEKVMLSNKLIIDNPSADLSVRAHMINILKQKESTNVSDKKDLFEKRVKALGSVCAHIKIDSHEKNRGICFNKLDAGIKLCKEMMAYGAVDTGTTIKELKNESTIKTLKMFANAGYHYVPAYSLVSGCKTGKELAESIMSSAVYLLIDD